MATMDLGVMAIKAKTKTKMRLFQRCYFVYILASLRGALYAGLTDDLKKRIMQHKDGTFDGFTKKYKIDRLMYFETYSDARAAAARELQIKKFRREKKIALFRESNPQWKDLTPEIFAVSFGTPNAGGGKISITTRNLTHDHQG